MGMDELLSPRVVAPNESRVIEIPKNDSADSVASDESTGETISESIEAPITDPWDFDDSEPGNFIVTDRYVDDFEAAMEEFYRDFSSDSGFSHSQYSLIGFKKPDAMARFVGLVPAIRPAIQDKERPDDTSIYLDLDSNTAYVKECQWPSNQMKKVLKASRVSCTVAVYHNFTIAFENEQEERHFIADCDWYNIKFGQSGKYTPSKFRLEPLGPVDPAVVEKISFDEAESGWSAQKEYEGSVFNLGLFRSQENAAKACSQFERLVTLIPDSLK